MQHSPALAPDPFGEVPAFDVQRVFGTAPMPAAASRPPTPSEPSAIEDVASADFRNAEEALGELSEMEDSIDMRFHRADAGAADFQVGQTPINALRGSGQETPNTRAARRTREQHERAAQQLADQQYFDSRVPGPDSSPRKTPPAQLYDPALLAQPTPQQTPRPGSAQSARSRRHGAVADSINQMTSSPMWGPSPASIPEERDGQTSGSMGDYGRGVTGALEDAESQTEFSIAPSLLVQLVPFEHSGGSPEKIGAAGVGARLAGHRAESMAQAASGTGTRSHLFPASISPVPAARAAAAFPGAALPRDVPATPNSPDEAVMTGFPGLHSIGQATPPPKQRSAGHRMAPNVSPSPSSPPPGFFGDSPLSVSRVSPGGSGFSGKPDQTADSRPDSFSRVGPAGAAMTSPNASPIATSQSPTHLDKVGFDVSPARGAQAEGSLSFDVSPARPNQLGADSHREASSPEGVGRSLAQQLSAASSSREWGPEDSLKLERERSAERSRRAFSDDSSGRADAQDGSCAAVSAPQHSEATSTQQDRETQTPPPVGGEVPPRTTARSSAAMQPDSRATAYRVEQGSQGGAGQLWMVESDHRDEPTERAQRPHSVSPPAIVPPTVDAGADVPNGASPLLAAGYAPLGSLVQPLEAGVGAARASATSVGGDYFPPSQRQQPQRLYASPVSAVGSTSPSSVATPHARPYPPLLRVGVGGYPAVAGTTAVGIRSRPATVLGLRTLSPTARSSFVSPFRGASSSWRSPLRRSYGGSPLSHFPRSSPLYRTVPVY